MSYELPDDRADEPNGWATLTVKEQLTMPWRGPDGLLAMWPKRVMALGSKVIGFRGAALVVTAWMVFAGVETASLVTWCAFAGAVILGAKFLDRWKR